MLPKHIVLLLIQTIPPQALEEVECERFSAKKWPKKFMKLPELRQIQIHYEKNFF